MDENVPTLAPGSIVVRNRVNIVFGVIAAGIAVGIDIFIGVAKSDLASLLEPAAIFGATAGATIGAASMVRAELFGDRLLLVNALRSYSIKRDAVEGLLTLLGVDVYLVDGREISVGVYPDALGKLWIGNSAGKAFAARVEELWGLRPLARGWHRDWTAKRIPDDSFAVKLSWEAPALTLLLGAASMALAALVRAVA